MTTRKDLPRQFVSWADILIQNPANTKHDCHPLNHNKTDTSYTSIYVLKNPKLINVYTKVCHLTLSWTS